MPTYNIYPYVNAQEDVEPTITVEISDDGSKVLSIQGADEERRADAERMINVYLENEFSPVEAIERYAGPYGEVSEASEEAASNE